MTKPKSHCTNHRIGFVFACFASLLATPQQLNAQAVYGDVTDSITELADLASNDFIANIGAIREYDGKIFLTSGNSGFAALTSLAAYDLGTNKTSSEKSWNRTFVVEQFERMQIADGDLWTLNFDSKDVTQYFLRRTPHRLQTIIMGFKDFDYTQSFFIDDHKFYFGSSNDRGGSYSGKFPPIMRGSLDNIDRRLMLMGGSAPSNGYRSDRIAVGSLFSFKGKMYATTGSWVNNRKEFIDNYMLTLDRETEEWEVLFADPDSFYKDRSYGGLSSASQRAFPIQSFVEVFGSNGDSTLIFSRSKGGVSQGNVESANRRLAGIQNIELGAPVDIPLEGVTGNMVSHVQTVCAREGHVFVITATLQNVVKTDPVIGSVATPGKTFVHQLVNHNAPLSSTSWKLLFEFSTGENPVGTMNFYRDITSDALEYHNGSFYTILGYRGWSNNNGSGTTNTNTKAGTLLRIDVDPLASPQLQTPRSVSTTAGDRHVEVNWEQVPYNPDYVLERSQNGGAWMEVARLIDDKRKYVDSGLANGKSYRYRVRAEGGINVPASAWGLSASVSLNGAAQAIPSPVDISLPTGSSFTGDQTLTLSSPTPGVTIYYTTDGSRAKSTHGALYTGPITLSDSVWINAVAVKDGKTSPPTNSEISIKNGSSFLLLSSNSNVTATVDQSDAPKITAPAGGDTGIWSAPAGVSNVTLDLKYLCDIRGLSVTKSNETTPFANLTVEGSVDSLNWFTVFHSDEIPTTESISVSITDSFRYARLSVTGPAKITQFRVFGNEPDLPPTQVIIDNLTTYENLPAQSVIGRLDVADLSRADSHSYVLISGDQSKFEIIGNQLLSSTTLSTADGTDYPITIRVTDSVGLYYDQSFTLKVRKQSEAPRMTVSLDQNLTTSVLVDLTAESTNGGWLTFKDTKDPNTASNQIQKLNPTTPIAYFERRGTDFTFKLPVLANGGWQSFGENKTVARTFTDGSGPAAAVYDSAAGNLKNAVPQLNKYKSGAGATDEWYGYNIDVSGLATATAFTGRFYYTELNHKPRFRASFFDVDNRILNPINSTEAKATSSNSTRTGIFKAEGIIPAGAVIVRMEAEHVNEGGGTHYFRLGGLSFSTRAPTGEVNSAPTNIALSSTSIAENQPIAAVVGNLTTTDANAGDSHTYTLVSGDTGNFAISGNQLRTAASFDFETKSSYRLIIRTTDSGGLTYDKAFTVSVTNVSEANSTRLDASGTVIFGGDGAAYDSGQDGQGGKPTSLNVSPDNLSVTITGNAWKRFPLTYTVTAKTMLEVTISASDIGEIVGLALDNDTAPTTGRHGFLLGGTDYANSNHNTWSWKIAPTYKGGDAARTYVIPVGSYFTGAVSYLGLIGDDDANGSTNINFSNLRLYESGAYAALRTAFDWGSTPTADRDADDDANKNGVSNLMEFAFNMSPTATGGAITLKPGTGTSGLPAVSVMTPATPTLRIEYLRRKNSGLSYKVKFSDDLVTWEDAIANPTPTSINTDWERMIMPDTAGAGRKKRFAKVEVTE